MASVGARLIQWLDYSRPSENLSLSNCGIQLNADISVTPSVVEATDNRDQCGIYEISKTVYLLYDTSSYGEHILDYSYREYCTYEENEVCVCKTEES